ncbi:TPA: DUF2972 domain-containing protein, partial [Campylobacter jejuni]|nr:DUF2972 domain-containing protein [Campylobacter jejuni]
IKKNKKIKLKCKKVFDEHLFFIKQYRPDIIDSWEYYQEFERIFKEK